jgi:hypothetical protein
LNIESDSLVINILRYYQDAIPEIQASENAWLKMQGRLGEYIYQHIKNSGTDMDYWKLLATPQGKYLCEHLVPWKQLYDRNIQLSGLGQTIIDQIDAEYPAN